MQLDQVNYVYISAVMVTALMLIEPFRSNIRVKKYKDLGEKALRV